MDPEEILEAVRAELGKFGEDIATKMQESNERVAKLDEAVAKLSDGTGEKVRNRWFGALAAGKPVVVPHDVGVEEAIERMRESEGVEHVVINGMRVPLFREAPRRGRGIHDTRGLLAVRMMRALAGAAMVGRAGDHEAAIDFVREWGDEQLLGVLEETRDVVRQFRTGSREERAAAARALGTANLGSGASLVAPTLFGELIDYLHPRSVVRSLGVATLPLNSGTLSLPYFTSAVQASYVEEHTGPNESSPGDARLNFVRKTLMAVAAISKELLRESSYSVDAFLRQHIAQVMASTSDLKFIRGDGTQSSIRGLRYWAGQSTGGGDAHRFNRTLDGSSAVTVDTITADALKAMRVVEESKVPLENLGWIFSVRDAYGLMSKRNSTTSAEIWPELRGGTFYGHPFKKTPQIPKNLAGDASGTGVNNKSEVYFAAFGSMAIAEQEGLEVNAYDGGAYKDASGNVVSGITNREVVITAEAAHDFGALYRGDEVACIESVDWGA